MIISSIVVANPPNNTVILSHTKGGIDKQGSQLFSI